ncbi:MAG: preprotein translocase subunit SecA [Candidatus Peregrinibacteria bacterium]
MLKWIESLLGDPIKKDLERFQKLVNEINSQEIALQDLSVDEFQAAVEKERGTSYEVEENRLRLLALAKNACRRLMGTKFMVIRHEQEWNMIPFDVQLIGALALLEGKISEMKTGEGKTLVAGIAASVAAFEGKGVHVVTVNDYLAERDKAWMTPLFEKLGHSVGVVVHGKNSAERRDSYGSHITYGTNNEFGFDYLRDNMAQRTENLVQRNLHFAIVDEVDSILIDEARTPLIISAPAEESTQKYMEYARLVESLEKEKDYTIDEKQKTAILTEEGIAHMEKLLGIENIYTEKGFTEVHHIEQSLRAMCCFQKDVDYVVKDGEIFIVDEFTGRMMPGRRYSGGLHQALEAKETVEVKRESKTLASITFQNYFRLYHHLAGMTGTAETEAEEFGKIYGLPVLPIPPNKPVVRNDLPDVVFKNEKGKFMAIREHIREKHATGQPVLIGTISIERSEILSALLTQAGIPHNVLNAKHHEQEAEIVANAGQKGAITIATNMAGRGTDIKLGEGVQELGGLAIIGSERHESRRIDNQLRGRAGRQGDPGETQFFVSLEDSLMRLFGSERLLNMMNAMNVPDDLPIQNGIISSGIESAQKKVEGIHFDRRKHVLQYDDVMNRHREIIYARRRKVLEHDDLRGEVLEMIETEASNIIQNATAHREIHQWDYSGIYSALSGIHNSPALSLESVKAMESEDELSAMAMEYLTNAYQEKESRFPSEEIARTAERMVYLQTIDMLFMEHLEAMTQLREQVALRAYGQRDPLMEFKGDAFLLFEKLLASIRRGTLVTLFHIEVEMRLPENPIEIQGLQTNENEIEENLGFTGPFAQKPASTKGLSGNITTVKVIDDGGTVKNTAPTGRNDLCPCGSGKKYKKCCGA